MKLVLYNDSNVVVETIENIHLPTVKENSVEWEDGSLTGINLPFCLFDDDADIPEVITDEIKALDNKEQFKKRDLAKENAVLKARLESAEMAIISLMDFM
jgi:hypothetical protein